MTFWIAVATSALFALGVGAAVLYAQRLASGRADALRRLGDDKAANVTDQVRFDMANPAALPMHIRGFDKPR